MINGWRFGPLVQEAMNAARQNGRRLGIETFGGAAEIDIEECEKNSDFIMPESLFDAYRFTDGFTLRVVEKINGIEYGDFINVKPLHVIAIVNPSVRDFYRKCVDANWNFITFGDFAGCGDMLICEAVRDRAMEAPIRMANHDEPWGWSHEGAIIASSFSDFFTKALRNVIDGNGSPTYWEREPAWETIRREQESA